MNGAFQKHLYHHQTIQRNTEMLFANNVCFPFTILVCLLWSFAPCVVWNMFETESRAIRITSMILRTTRFYVYCTQKFALTWPLIKCWQCYPHYVLQYTSILPTAIKMSLLLYDENMTPLNCKLFYSLQKLVASGPQNWIFLLAWWNPSWYIGIWILKNPWSAMSSLHIQLTLSLPRVIKFKFLLQPFQ